QQRADTTDDSGHVAIPDHQHPPLGRHVDLVVVDPNYAAVLVPHHRAGHPGPAARRLERDAHGGLEARLRGSGATRVADAAFLGDEQRVHQAHRLDAHPREQPLHRSYGSAVEDARGGVRITRSSLRSGASAGSGSTANTSIAAPPMRLSRTASASAASSTSSPRAVFTRTAVGFMSLSRSALIR